MMPPLQFLMLTTTLPPAQWIEKELKEIYPVEQYNAWQKDGTSLLMPWLEVTWDGPKKGKIVGHEGRHRAAAMIRAGWKSENCMPVAILLKEDGKWPTYYVEKWGDASDNWSHSKRMLTLEDVPTTFIGQYDGYRFKPNFSTWKGFYSAETSTLQRIQSRLELA